MRQRIESAVQILRANPNASDDEILDLVIANGIERPLAMQLVALLPLAYGRVMLSDTVGSFSDTYICVGEEGQSERKGSLDTLPLWREAINFARQDQEPFLPIAGRSCEIRTANAALRDGTKLQNLVWGPPVFLWPVDSFPGSGRVETKAARWWRQMWNAPAAHSLSRSELTIARCAMVVAIFAGLLAVGVLVYYVIAILRELP